MLFAVIALNEDKLSLILIPKSLLIDMSTLNDSWNQVRGTEFEFSLTSNLVVNN